MSNSGLKGREIRLKKEFMQILGERDESVAQAFSQMDNNIRKAFTNMEFKFAILFSVLEDLGIPQSRLQEIAETLQQQSQQQANPQGGEHNENPYGGAPTDEGEPTTSQTEATESAEGGEDRFRRD